jgi:pyridoxine kinase
MGRILAISSQVVRGHVGLSAIVPALQRLGHEVLPLPTIVLSNHPGHKRASGTRMEVNTLASMVEVLDANGWLAGLDAIITGYMPSMEHVGCVAKAIDLGRARSPTAIVLVDPVLGDDPRGLYIDPTAAAAIRDELVPRADIITPNRFELSWLAGCDVHAASDVRAAHAQLSGSTSRPNAVLATSIPAPNGHLANVYAQGGSLDVCQVERLAKAPHGTGDLLTGLYVGRLVSQRRSPADALGAAVGGVRQAIANSQSLSDLNLAVADGAADWALAAPCAIESGS